ncbi:hypothetical protein WICPIJ_010166, partial [Wickerhamomyces pijperi]
PFVPVHRNTFGSFSNVELTGSSGVGRLPFNFFNGGSSSSSSSPNRESRSSSLILGGAMSAMFTLVTPVGLYSKPITCPGSSSYLEMTSPVFKSYWLIFMSQPPVMNFVSSPFNKTSLMMFVCCFQ